MEKQVKTVSGPPWPGVRYFSTTVAEGYSRGDWAGLNLGQHCGDDANHVGQNRALLNTLLPSEPHWLQQVHSTHIYRALQPAKRVSHFIYDQAPRADAAWTATPNTVIAVLTADCLPVVISDTNATVVGVVHAGWRGLAAGVIERLFLQLMQQAGADANWQVWIGPSISQKHFEVGPEVYKAFVEKNSLLKRYFISTITSDKYLADLAGIAANKIRQVSSNQAIINFSNACTYAEKNKYYSYRRQASTGRMATLAWLA